MTKATKCPVKLFISSLDILRRVQSSLFFLVIKIIKKTSKADTITLQDTPPPPLEVGSLVKILVNVDIKRILAISEVGE